MNSMVRRGVGACVVASALLLSGQASAQCYLDFNNHASLAAIPESAESTFVVGPPWYTQTCSDPTGGYVPIATVAALNLSHYHLSYEDPNACLAGAHFGTLVNGVCQAYSDPAAQPRTLQNMNGTTGATISMGGEQFDLDRLDVLASSATVEVTGVQADGVWFRWNLGPNRWTFPPQGRSFTSLSLQTTAKTGIFNVDNISLWPSFQTHRFDNGNSQGVNMPDFDPGRFKAACSPGAYSVNGISFSTAANARAHSTRCKYNALSFPPFAVVNFQGSDGRRSTSTGDWDSGFAKGECSDTEAVSGVSQTSSGLLAKLQCARVNATANSCVVRTSQPASRDKVDWASGFFKAECADDEMVKGISHNNSGGVRRILCCRYPGQVR